MNNEKICIKCHKLKSLKEFGIRKDNNKYRNWCKECQNELNRKWYHQRKEGNNYIKKEKTNYYDEQLEYSAKLLANNISLDKKIERLKQELQRKDNIINELKEWLDKEKENYNLELTKKNVNALSYSLPIKSVYKDVLDKIKELENAKNS